MTEQEKYEAMYAIEEYRKVSPGHSAAPKFCERFLRGSKSIIVFGCGPGRAGKYFRDQGHEVCMLDIAGNCLDEAVKAALDDRLYFIRCDFAHLSPDIDKLIPSAEWGYCVDVMEHLPTGDVPNALRTIRDKCQFAYFQISGVADGCGKWIGETLHLTVKPRDWWREMLECFWSDAVDLNPESKGSTYQFVCRRPRQ